MEHSFRETCGLVAFKDFSNIVFFSVLSVYKSSKKVVGIQPYWELFVSLRRVIVNKGCV